MTTATLITFTAVICSFNSSADASSVNMLLLELRMVLLVTLVWARETVKDNCAVNQTTPTGSTCAVTRDMSNN
jgi:hypothetical protein